MDTEVKKKPLKTIVTFSSEEVFEKAIAEPNTSALIEALLAKYHGIDIEGDSVQIKWRKHYADKLSDVELDYVEVDTPAAPEPQVLDDINDEDGDIAEDEPVINDPLGAYTEAPAEELALPEVPTADTAPIVPTPAPDVLPDRPVDAVQSEAPAFVPADAGSPSVTEATQVQEQTEPVVEPAPEEDTSLPVGRYCPNCLRPMGDSPHCLYCI